MTRSYTGKDTTGHHPTREPEGLSQEDTAPTSGTTHADDHDNHHQNGKLSTKETKYTMKRRLLPTLAGLALLTTLGGTTVSQMSPVTTSTEIVVGVTAVSGGSRAQTVPADGTQPATVTSNTTVTID